MSPKHFFHVAAIVVILLFSTVIHAEPGYIAGVNPSSRPAGAPVISSVHKDAAWYRHALYGVIPPYPASLRFLEDQGNWYTPFTRPGMTGRYDIRGWHRH